MSNMVRRIVVAKPTIDNVQQIQTSIRRVVQPFHPKTDVEKALYGEIEVSEAKRWWLANELCCTANDYF